MRAIVALLQRLSATLFLPLRKLAGPLHRRRPALSEEQTQQEKQRPPLPGVWGQDNRWYRGGFPPRRHNALLPLLHGEEYFSDLYQMLQTARTRVTICGWCLTPLMPLLRGDRQATSILADVLDAVSAHAEVYVLLWAGAPVLFQPSVQAMEQVCRTLHERAPRVRCELDRRASFSHDHHQKAITVDGRVAYVGGIDLSTFQGDRWDTKDHHLRFGPNWHDVQVRLEGEVVRDIEENFCQRWNAVTGDHLEPLPTPEPDPAWNTPAQIVRTVPAGFYPFAPNGEYGIRHALLAAISRADRYIHLENQYIWSPEVVEALMEAMNRPHSGEFRIVLILPARAYTGKYDNDEHVRLLHDADGSRGIFHAYSLYASGPAFGLTGYRYLPIYVHGKVSIVDDEWLSVGSANLNRRGLGTDTEMNVQAVAPDLARRLRVRLWAEHLGMTEEAVAAVDPVQLIDREFKRTAATVSHCVRCGDPPPGGHLHLYVPGSNPGSRLLDLMQDVTLEH